MYLPTFSVSINAVRVASRVTATNTVSYIRPRSQSCYWRRQRRVAAVGVASSVFTFCPRVLAQPTPTNSVLHPCDFGKHLYSLRNRRTCTIIMFYIDDDDYDVCLRYLFEKRKRLNLFFFERYTTLIFMVEFVVKGPRSQGHMPN